MKSNMHMIVLLINGDDYKNEEPDNKDLTPEELLKQGRFVNEDMAGMYGYEAWMTIFDVPEDVLNKLGELCKESYANS